MVKYDENYRSKDTEYRTSGKSRLPGGGAGLALGGLGGIGAIIVMLLTAFSGGSEGGGLGDIFGAQVQAPTGNAVEEVAPEQRNAFLEFVFDDVQQTWSSVFDSAGERYEPARFVIFTNAVATGGCGNATSDVGPFYCPADSNVYLDQAFFDELASRFGAPGDFAQAYVIAHEVGHHVQNVLGISADTRRRQQSDPGQANDLSVLLELQADCLAGVWGFSARERGLLEQGDLEEGLRAAAAVGDDRIQESAGQQVNPESWTHGSSEQRINWFNVGFTSGDPSRCNTLEGT